MKIEKNLSLIISIATILLSVGASWGVIETKVKDIDKVKENLQDSEKKVIAVEVKLEDIKEATREIQKDLKDILRKL